MLCLCLPRVLSRATLPSRLLWTGFSHPFARIQRLFTLGVAMAHWQSTCPPLRNPSTSGWALMQLLIAQYFPSTLPVISCQHGRQRHAFGSEVCLIFPSISLARSSRCVGASFKLSRLDSVNCYHSSKNSRSCTFLAHTTMSLVCFLQCLLRSRKTEDPLHCSSCLTRDHSGSINSLFTANESGVPRLSARLASFPRQTDDVDLVELLSWKQTVQRNCSFCGVSLLSNS